MNALARLRFPHPFVILVAATLVAAALTWVLPAGEFDRREDAETGRKVVVAGTFHPVAAQPAGVVAAVAAIPRGLVRAADVVAFVFLVGGAFSVVDATGALRRVVDVLADRLGSRRGWVVPLLCGVFALGGALENLQEEIIALVPVLLLLCRRLGFDPLVTVAASIGAASVGSAFSPVNPFQAVLAQKLAGLPALSAWELRVGLGLLALAVWTWATWRVAATPGKRAGGQIETATVAGPATEPAPAGRAPGVVLGLVGLAFAAFVWGVVRLKWGFEEMTVPFFLMGVLAGLVGGLGFGGTAEAFLRGFRDMSFAALLIGFARGILVVLEDGHVVDTLVAGLFTPLQGLPVGVAAAGMVGGQAVLHFAVASVGGQAALTLPILVPLADLLGLSRQAVVLAYQTGAGLCELLIPTNGALMAILGASGVSYGRWLRFVLPVYAVLLAVGLAATVLAAVFGLR